MKLILKLKDNIDFWGPTPENPTIVDFNSDNFDLGIELDNNVKIWDGDIVLVKYKDYFDIIREHKIKIVWKDFSFKYYWVGGISDKIEYDYLFDLLNFEEFISIERL